MTAETPKTNLLTVRQDTDSLSQWSMMAIAIHDAMGRGKSGLEIWEAVSSELGYSLKKGTKEMKKATQLLTPDVAGLLISINNLVFGEEKRITMKQLKQASVSPRVNRYLK